MKLDPALTEAFGQLLGQAEADRALVAEALILPDELYLADLMEPPVDPEAIHLAREHARRAIAGALRGELLAAYTANREAGEYRVIPDAIARRRLRDVCLAYLVALGEAETLELARGQYREAASMTDMLGGLRPLVTGGHAGAEEVLDDFYRRWSGEPEVVDKWLAVQAASPALGTLERIRSLMDHPVFNFKNPNKVRAVLGAFARGNPYRFHQADGAAYTFFADQVLAMDGINPQMAAGLARALSRFARYDDGRRERMRAELERIRDAEGLSRDSYEIVAKSLGEAV